MGETGEFIDSMRCDECMGCDEPEMCSMSGFNDDDPEDYDSE